MNYSKAIELLYRVENTEVVQLFAGNTDKLKRELERVARRKFNFIVSMQRYSKFTSSRVRARDWTSSPQALSFPATPFLETESPTTKTTPTSSTSTVGEYLQLIDTNQDNYLEECLKIQNVLAEFEEYAVPLQSMELPGLQEGSCRYCQRLQVHLLREHWYPHSWPPEQTFDTLSARSVAWTDHLELMSVNVSVVSDHTVDSGTGNSEAGVDLTVGSAQVRSKAMVQYLLHS